jgi:RNA polymerase sigma factor (sigma-70 family)
MRAVLPWRRVSTKPRRDRYKQLLQQHLRRVYNFCFRMTLDHTRAVSATEEVFLRAYVGEAPEDERVEVWLLHIANHVLEQRLPRTPEVDFDLLDETLRSEATRTDVVRSLTDPQRDFMLWELKQGCMTSVVNCLSPGERAAFVASSIMKMSDEAAAQALGVTPAAFKVRLSRARKKVGDYLAPRCEHVNPMNPCRCPARVGVALRKGFIRPQGTVQLRQPQQPYGRYGAGPESDDQPERDVQVIYGNLPEPDVPAGFEQQLLQAIENGQWDRVRDKKLSGKPG